ncbi:hypothetical protein HYH03_002223 [Edaphochlamys debaryana]|uniref:EamA domain-containing protein n=1 Tax=Edaphochlamys debaryana TaxID=47281 RepID=A0A835YC76_9CHLO|nr:hypothetical protein HYH03_002223 [Edaphochlamys debaryana]|eukprot:KAG2499936.1 hypothetical protein HYH03_002223 [Edaphochlamys debaryana]
MAVDAGPGVGSKVARSKQVYGSALLLLVAVLWASSAPTLRYLFLLPTPPSAALVTACVSLISAAFLAVSLLGSAMEPAASEADASPQPRGRRVSGAGGGRARGHSLDAEAAVADSETAPLMPRHGSAVAGGASGAAASPFRSRWAHVTGQDGLVTGSEDDSDMDAREREAEALLHSGLHVNGAAGPGGGASMVARRAARAVERQHQQQRSTSSGGACAVPHSDSHMHAHPHAHAHAGNGDAGAAGPRAKLAGASGDDTGAIPARVSLDGMVCPASPGRSVHGGSGAEEGPPRWRIALLSAPARSLWGAGLELGFYNTAAAALAAFAMQRISATRSAFLAQATSLITPLLVCLSGARVGMWVWVACFFGSVGGAMVALDAVHSGGSASDSAHSNSIVGAAPPAASPDAASGGYFGAYPQIGPLVECADGSGAVAAASRGLAEAVAVASAAAASGGGTVSTQTMGAVYMLLSCLFWGMGTVRLGVHSARFEPLQLASAAAGAYAGLSVLWVMAEALTSPEAGLADFIEVGVLVQNHAALALLLWAGLGPGALSNYLQTVGQRTVPPAQTQVLFSSTPLWSALMAQLLLPGEAMGPLAWAGGAIMVAASLLASLMT